MLPQPGLVAQLALLLVVPATFVAFAFLSPLRAVLVLFFGGILFLPERVAFDAPLIPPLDKHSTIAICVMVGVWFTSRSKIRSARVGRGVDRLLILALVMIVGTVLTNRDALRYGPRTVQGYVPGDILSEGIAFVLATALPFLLGRMLFRSEDDARDLLRAFVVGGLIYAPLVVVELRLSPQWHNWIYGFGQHRFGQTVREGGGYRPMCFMAHGLALAMFMWGSAVAAWTLVKDRSRLFGLPVAPFAWLLTILFPFIKSLAALVYLTLAVPVGWLVRPKTQLRLAFAIVCLVAAYPVLRITGVFPTEALTNLAAKISDERRESLEFRFRHEDKLISKALDRPTFGWGTYGRNRLYNKYGQDASVVDGAWIRIMGVFGIAGLVLHFGVLLLPILIARRRVDEVAPAGRPLLAGVTVMAAFFTVDLLPNGIYNGFPPLLAGAVLGLTQGMSTSRGRLVDELALRWAMLLRGEASVRTRQIGT